MSVVMLPVLDSRGANHVLRMRARQLIDAASFGPDAVKVLGQAFDAAWRDIAGNFGNDPNIIEAARLKLANALFSVASDDSRDVEVLKNAALAVMAGVRPGKIK